MAVRKPAGMVAAAVRMVAKSNPGARPRKRKKAATTAAAPACIISR